MYARNGDGSFFFFHAVYVPSPQHIRNHFPTPRRILLLLLLRVFIIVILYI